MTKPRTPNQKKRYTSLNKRLAKYVALVQSIYDETAKTAAELALDVAYAPESEKPFRFKDYPIIKKRVDDMQSFFFHDLRTLIYAGTSSEWKESNLVQDLLANDVLRTYRAKRNGIKVDKYYQTNSDALNAFRLRKDNGMSLSQKIWNQSENMKREMEYCISSAIQKGTSAVTLSKKISKYLHDFPKLKKDYKEKYGKAVECQDCEYRSIRLARSEINMAYRTAEQTRWEQMDFIKGYEIKLSGSHPKHDICDELAGVYPKWFKWTGWHPNDLCYVIPIVMTDDEFYSGKSNEITDVPDNFKVWVNNNLSRIENSKSLPYFIRDNLEVINKISKDSQSEALKVAKQRHNARSEERITRIKKLWYIREMYRLMDDVRNGVLPSAALKSIEKMFNEVEQNDFTSVKNRISLLKAASKRHRDRGVDKIRELQDNADRRKYGQEYVDHIHKIEEAIGIKRTKRMTYEEANSGRENPKYNEDKQYKVNCQTCTYVHMLRRLGFDVTSMGNNDGDVWQFLKDNGMTWQSRFTTNGKDGLQYRLTYQWGTEKGYKRITRNMLNNYLNEKLTDDGIYEIYTEWKSGSAHVFLCEVKDGKKKYYDPQNGNNDVSSYIDEMKTRMVSVERIDDKMLNCKFLPRVIPPQK